MTARSDGRAPGARRPVGATPGFHRASEGSVLYRSGNTVVLCTASVDDGVPPWMDAQPGGWLTAEYQMHPRAAARRRDKREGRSGPSGRTMEIQRLIGRSLRSAMDLKALGRRTITLDCDVLEADGGTRTASVTGGFIAVALALHRLDRRGAKAALRDQVAAVSVGLIGDEVAVDLDYVEDVAARVDMNVVATARGALVEVQATAEGVAIPRERFDAMVDAAIEAIGSLHTEQRAVLAEAGVDLTDLLQPG